MRKIVVIVSGLAVVALGVAMALQQVDSVAAVSSNAMVITDWVDPCPTGASSSYTGKIVLAKEVGGNFSDVIAGGQACGGLTNATLQAMTKRIGVVVDGSNTVSVGKAFGGYLGYTQSASIYPGFKATMSSVNGDCPACVSSSDNNKLYIDAADLSTCGTATHRVCVYASKDFAN